MRTIKCRMVLKDGTIKTYKSRNGKDFIGPNGGQYKAPVKAHGEILERENWLGITLRRAWYREGIATAVPIAAEIRDKKYQEQKPGVVEHQVHKDGSILVKLATPRVYGPKDVNNLEGDFLVNLMKHALKNDKQDRIIQIATLVCSGVSAFAGLAVLWFIRGMLNV